MLGSVPRNACPVELLDNLGMLEHDLGDDRTRLQVATALELEEVPLRTHDGTLLEAVDQSLSRSRDLVGSLGHPAHPAAMWSERPPLGDMAGGDIVS